MRIIGITGQIGTGKSTASAMLAKLGAVIFDADTVAKSLTKDHAPALVLINRCFPGVVSNGVLDRQQLARLAFASRQSREMLEALLHPLINRMRQQAIAKARRQGRRLLILDIPLLQEKNLQYLCQTVIVSHVSKLQQRRRVLARPLMTALKLKAVLQHQWPQARKCAKADIVIHTGNGYGAVFRLLRGVALRQGWFLR